MALSLVNATLVLRDRELPRARLDIEDAKIARIVTERNQAETGAALDLAGAKLIPGFIDVHIHGAVGHDVMTATPDQLKALPGMTEGYVMMIVGARPFQSKEELIERKILPQDAYDQMKDRIATKGSSGGASRPQASPNPPPKSTLATDPIEKSSEGSEASASTGSSSSSRVCIKEERTKQQFCGELVK